MSQFLWPSSSCPVYMHERRRCEIVLSQIGSCVRTSTGIHKTPVYLISFHFYNTIYTVLVSISHSYNPRIQKSIP